MDTVHEFIDFWFAGDLEEKQSFWFCATKNKKLFRRVHEKYGSYLPTVASLETRYCEMLAYLFIQHN